mgnify:CR=1 FL=1
MEKAKRFWKWLVVSSADPEKTALTIKGLLLGMVPAFILVLRSFGVGEVGDIELIQTINSGVAVFVAVTGTISAAMTFYGFLRKLYLTFR